ncbi:hypothetical protein [Curtobacterium sp. RRHDQ10]|uniref:hypothetical protein n=1 Tax=Curtobacterium phyllosphaerae TaxID=3413379 RepID=UPI003BEFFCF0
MFSIGSTTRATGDTPELSTSQVSLDAVSTLRSGAERISATRRSASSITLCCWAVPDDCSLESVVIVLAFQFSRECLTAPIELESLRNESNVTTALREPTLPRSESRSDTPAHLRSASSTSRFVPPIEYTTFIWLSEFVEYTLFFWSHFAQLLCMSLDMSVLPQRFPANPGALLQVLRRWLMFHDLLTYTVPSLNCRT